MKERKRNRMAGYDYSSDSLYYITSCVENRHHSFGRVVNKQMILNLYGQIAFEQWLWLEKQYRYVSLHAFQIMPNHMHGIIEINRARVAIDS